MVTRIAVQTGFFPMAWFLYFVSPIVELNGQINKRNWGTSFFDVTPGEYLVRIYFPYLGNSQCGVNQIQVKVEEGQTVKISYYMPPWMLAKGKISISI
jgi:hypothetical protein